MDLYLFKVNLILQLLGFPGVRLGLLSYSKVIQLGKVENEGVYSVSGEVREQGSLKWDPCFL